MKILFYLTRYPDFGGIEKVTETLADYLIKQGDYSISILSFIQNSKANKKNERIKYYQTPSKEFNSPENNHFAKKLFDKEEFDIVIFQDSYAPIEDTLFNALHESKCKIITVEHNTPDCGWIHFWYKLHHTHKTLRDLLLCPYHYWYMASHTKSRHRKLYIKSDKYVVLSKNFIPILSKRFKMQSLEKYCYINNPTTIPVLKESSHLSKRHELLFVGRFSKQKGIDILLNIWKQLYPNYPGWTLKLVGGGELEPFILDYIRKNKLKNIQLEGFNTDTSKYYQNASILCMTSIFEGWGLVLTEAMSRGCIPVAFKSFSSITDIIDDKENGFLIPPFKQKLFIEKLKYLMDNTKEREVMTTKAILKSEHFSINNIGKKWKDLFSIITQ